MSKDDYGSAIIAEGQRRGITARGVQIALATVFVESNFVMYANAKVPASMSLPHEAVGSDGMSVGLFQQQVRDDGNGWWWGDAATCMSPTLSAGLFYDRLAKLDYNGPNSPGSYAQAVQQSAFPDRYDEHFADAATLYNRLTTGAPVTDPNRPDFNEYPLWTTNSQSRTGTVPDLFLLHTEQSSGTDNADGLAHFLISTQGGANPVSYHYTISQAADGGVTVVDCVDTDQASWSVGNSNDRSINLCFAGSDVAWTRDQWLLQSKAIDVAAYLAVQDCRKYGVPLRVLKPPYSSPGGVSDHRYCTDYLKDGNNHSDVGGPMSAPWTNFPWDYFEASFTKYVNPTVPAPVVTPPVITPPATSGPVDVEREIWDQLRIPWAQLGGQTLINAVGEMRDKLLGVSDYATWKASQK